MVDIRYNVSVGGDAPFVEWFAELEPVASARISRAMPAWSKAISPTPRALERALEYKIDFGPGYRVYFGRDGDTIVILLTGGTKKRQQRDIDAAKAYWRDYKLSKRGRR
jgi:putative addiction module killer protein